MNDTGRAGRAPAAADTGRAAASVWPSVAAGGRLIAALALLSAAGLLFEISLTRVLSLLFFSTFSYLVLSLAVLGLAAGAALATLLPAAREPANWPLWTGLAALTALLLTLYASVPAFSAARSLLLLLTAVPYLFIGLAIAGIFAQRAQHSPRLYLADLAGAGAGSLLAVPLLDLLGGLGGMMAAALAAALSSLVLAPRSLPALLASVLSALVLLLHALGTGPDIDLGRLATPKPIRESLRADGEIVRSEWNSFARTDLVRQSEAASGGDRFLIYLDGGAASLVPDAGAPGTWTGDIGALAFAVEPPEAAFLIGPGGGLDIALARSFDTDGIVAAEINRSAVTMTRELAAHAGDLYGPGTELLLDDGRSALRRRGGEYDLILLSQVVSGAAEARGLALVENGLYTTEALEEYLRHLTPEGRIAFKLYDELTLTRALTTALAALRARGIPESEGIAHLFAALDTRASPPVPLLIVSATPLGRTEAIAWAREAEARGFALLLVPGLLTPPALAGVAEGRVSLADVVAASPEADLRPTTDERPFFYQFETGLPRALRPLAVAVTLVTLLTLAIATLAGRLGRGLEPLLAPTMVAALGAGFMLLEIGVLQRSQLVIGHPALTLSAVLAALLLGAALGSGIAGRCPAGREHTWIALAGFAAALLGLAWSASWGVVVPSLQGLSPQLAALATALTLAPLAFVLGFPFPLLLRSLGGYGPRPVALAWTVNGTASVAGAVAATALGVSYGFHEVAGVAALLYSLVGTLALVLAVRR